VVQRSRKLIEPSCAPATCGNQIINSHIENARRLAQASSSLEPSFYTPAMVSTTLRVCCV